MKSCVFLLSITVLCLRCDRVKCQKLVTPDSNGRFITNYSPNYGSYGWKVPIPTRPGRIRVDVIPKSTFGNVDPGDTDLGAQPKVIRPVPYVPSLPVDINLVRLAESNDIDSDDPPPHRQVAKMARYIVAESMWTSLATISSRGVTAGSPFSTILSVSDGIGKNSTGNPYLYLTPLNEAAKDLKVNSNASLVMTLAQSDYCVSRRYDPEDPRCAKVSLTGRIVELPKDSEEEKFAKSALFYKHPVMKTWPRGHNWFVAKLEIRNISVLDYFGGARDVPLREYFAANPNN